MIIGKKNSLEYAKNKSWFSVKKSSSFEKHLKEYYALSYCNNVKGYSYIYSQTYPKNSVTIWKTLHTCSFNTLADLEEYDFIFVD